MPHQMRRTKGRRARFSRTKRAGRPARRRAGQRASGLAVPRRLRPASFAVAGIQVSSVVLTCLRWHPSQPGVMKRLPTHYILRSRGIFRVCTVTVIANL